MPSKNTRKGICPRCKRNRQMTSHHILPKVHFRETGERADLCRLCHNDFEKILEYVEGKNAKGGRRKLSIWIYRELFDLYIKAGEKE